MSEVNNSTPERCSWCRFHPDTRKVFALFMVLLLMIAVSRGSSESCVKSTVPQKEQIRLIPMGTKTDENGKVVESPIPSQPYVIEMESTQ